MLFERSDQSSNPTHFFRFASSSCLSAWQTNIIGAMSEGIEHAPAECHTVPTGPSLENKKS